MGRSRTPESLTFFYNVQRFLIPYQGMELTSLTFAFRQFVSNECHQLSRPPAGNTFTFMQPWWSLISICDIITIDKAYNSVNSNNMTVKAHTVRISTKPAWRPTATTRWWRAAVQNAIAVTSASGNRSVNCSRKLFIAGFCEQLQKH